MTRTIVTWFVAIALFCSTASAVMGQPMVVGQGYPGTHGVAYSPSNYTPGNFTPNTVPAGAAWQSRQTPISTYAQRFDQRYVTPAGCTVPPPLAENIGCVAGCDAVGCADIDCESCFGCGFYGGFAFVWMRPRFDQNAAIVIDPVPGNTVVPFSYDREITPRAWFGYQNAEGGGLRVRYWEFDAAANTEVYSPIPAATPAFLFVYGASGNLARNAFADVGETMTSDHALELTTIDLEATQRFHWHNIDLLAGLGLRYAQMDQVGQAIVTDGAGALSESVHNDHDFEGIGPMISLEIVRPLLSDRFSIYGSLRGSILLGDASQRITEVKNGGADMVTDVVNQDDILSIGEIELGLQFSRPWGDSAVVFIRGGYEGQVWWGAGGPTDTASNLGLDGVSLSLGIYR
ncbi:MAG: Lpg1974 family pore-forming outer membrane protein [Planctomycetota bacterium]|nr:Lpg1974 family pore-forming outer membrane protein [Planctomycetota bacterium]